MSRAVVTVREAVPDDAAALVHLWRTAPDDDPGLGAEPASDDELSRRTTEAASAVARIGADPGERLLVARLDDDVAGAVHLRRGQVSPIQTQQAIHVSYLMVDRRMRRRGVASALLSAATAWADEKDTTHLVATTNARSRESNRFLARLGFSQIGVIRVAQVSALSGIFAGRACGSRDTGRLIAVRRTLRRRHPDQVAEPL